METFPALLPLCEGNPPVPGGFPSQRPVTGSFDVFFDLRLNNPLGKHSRRWWFKTPPGSLWRHSNVTNGMEHRGPRHHWLHAHHTPGSIFSLTIMINNKRKPMLLAISFNRKCMCIKFWTSHNCGWHFFHIIVLLLVGKHPIGCILWPSLHPSVLLSKLRDCWSADFTLLFYVSGLST